MDFRNAAITFTLALFISNILIAYTGTIPYAMLGYDGNVSLGITPPYESISNLAEDFNGLAEIDMNTELTDDKDTIPAAKVFNDWLLGAESGSTWSVLSLVGAMFTGYSILVDAIFPPGTRIAMLGVIIKLIVSVLQTLGWFFIITELLARLRGRA